MYTLLFETADFIFGFETARHTFLFETVTYTSFLARPISLATSITKYSFLTAHRSIAIAISLSTLVLCTYSIIGGNLTLPPSSTINYNQHAVCGTFCILSHSS